MLRRCDKPLYPENAYFAIFGEVALPPDARETLEYVMDTLEPREAGVFMSQYRDDMIYVKIGEKYGGITRERVRQIIIKALRKLRHPSRSKILRMGREAYLNTLAANNEEKKREYTARIAALEDIIQAQDTEIVGYQNKLLDLNKQLHPNSDPLNMCIDDLDLSVRSWNCLKRAGVSTIKDILDLDDLIRVRNMNRACIQEIRDKLESLGISAKC